MYCWVCAQHHMCEDVYRCMTVLICACPYTVVWRVWLQDFCALHFIFFCFSCCHAHKGSWRFIFATWHKYTACCCRKSAADVAASDSADARHCLLEVCMHCLQLKFRTSSDLQAFLNWIRLCLRMKRQSQLSCVRLCQHICESLCTMHAACASLAVQGVRPLLANKDHSVKDIRHFSLNCWRPLPAKHTLACKSAAHHGNNRF